MKTLFKTEITTFKNLEVGDEIMLQDMNFTAYGTIEAIEDSIIVRWYDDDSTDLVHKSQEIEIVEEFRMYACGWQVKR